MLSILLIDTRLLAPTVSGMAAMLHLSTICLDSVDLVPNVRSTRLNGTELTRGTFAYGPIA